MNKSIVIAGVAAAIMLAANGANAVSVVNGGFEADAASVPASGVYFGPITGWNNAGYLTSAGYYSALPPEGRVFALVGNGIDTTGYHTNQTLTGLTVGRSYDVRFALASEDFVIPGTVEQVNVFISAGSTSASQLYSAPVSSNLTSFGPGPLWDHWAYFDYRFVAGATSATLDFEQTAATTGAGDTGVDDVSISAVPEPAAWALLIVGVGGVGASLRRKSRICATA